jgi:phytoene synthase
MIDKTLFSIFQQGSKTYFYSSLFFPTYMKRDVFTLYGFVRKADNYVDSIPQDVQGFYDFKKTYYRARAGTSTDDIVIDSFIELEKRKAFNPHWVDAFLASMEMDIIKQTYHTLDQTLQYIYGSAEVIGLMMAKIMNLPEESYFYARSLGKAMQYINFIRDIAEDIQLGRIYLPSDDLKKYGLLCLDYDYTKQHPEKFSHFLMHQLRHYCRWQYQAEQGFSYIPKRYLIPIKTASQMYHWTAEQIFKNPYIIYSVKVKPMVLHIIKNILLNIVDPQKTMSTSLSCMRKDPLFQGDW